MTSSRMCRKHHEMKTIIWPELDANHPQYENNLPKYTMIIPQLTQQFSTDCGIWGCQFDVESMTNQCQSYQCLWKSSEPWSWHHFLPTWTTKSIMLPSLLLWSLTLNFRYWRFFVGREDKRGSRGWHPTDGWSTDIINGWWTICIWKMRTPSPTMCKCHHKCSMSCCTGSRWSSRSRRPTCESSWKLYWSWLSP